VLDDEQPQVPDEQTVPLAHALVHEPQWLGSLCVFTHAPPHSIVPVPQAQDPPEQV
jgi:hypothetical protein